ncbi:MAG: hypothetical protein WD081_00280 [Gammaproteobacteria bacterium]
MSTRALATCAVALALLACAPADDEIAADATIASPSETDIWVAELLDSGRRMRVGAPSNATDRPGYDNQPFFLPGGSAFLYTSIDASGQADVWRHEFDRGRSYRVTRTAESEFSPTPHADGTFTVIRVEADGRQRLWRFDGDGENPALLLPDIEPVGYQAWVDEHRVALFILGEPPTLASADVRSGAPRSLLSSIGRALHRVPGKSTVSVVHKAAENDWQIVEVDLESGDVSELAPLLRPAEDYAWLPDGQLIMGRGSKLYLRRPGDDREWRELADFSAHGITQITRIAVSPGSNRIAFVAQR